MVGNVRPTNIELIISIFTGFVLGTPKHIYRFLALTEEEKKTWFTTIHKMIFAQKQLFSKVCKNNFNI